MALIIQHNKLWVREHVYHRNAAFISGIPSLPLSFGVSDQHVYTFDRPPVGARDEKL
jgi:hypothetical protein